MRMLLPSRIIDDDLTIQRWTAMDIDPMEVLIVENLGHLRPWMAWAAREPITPEQRRSLFLRWDRYREAGRGAVYSVRVDDELVGGCAIHRDVESRCAGIGYWLAKNATGRGTATRTSGALTETALNLDDIDFVQISHERSNTRSGAVAGRLGYTRVATETPGEVRWRMDRTRWVGHPTNESRPHTEHRND